MYWYQCTPLRSHGRYFAMLTLPFLSLFDLRYCQFLSKLDLYTTLSPFSFLLLFHRSTWQLCVSFPTLWFLFSSLPHKPSIRPLPYPTRVCLHCWFLSVLLCFPSLILQLAVFASITSIQYPRLLTRPLLVFRTVCSLCHFFLPAFFFFQSSIHINSNIQSYIS